MVWEVIQVPFYQLKIHYLGHLISDAGIYMDPTKVEAIMEWPAPSNVPEVHSLMGLTGYYQWFVEGFSKIENMIVEIAEEEQEVFWDREMRGSISEAQRVVENNTDTKGLGYGRGLLGMH